VIPLGRHVNVATFNLSPGFTQYSVFCAKAGFDPKEELKAPNIAKPSQIVSSNDATNSGTKSG
jgi:hypothetical protein